MLLLEEGLIDPAMPNRLEDFCGEAAKGNVPLVVEDRTAAIAADALLYFPSTQIHELTLALTTIEVDTIR
ncbi:hypothetical protein ACFQ93_35965 [Streptomyces sp. NPDC056601]|uniref:hypothetical protein n=1 Tax=Streptomyces sp. NPDC056601 TaxID=3345875 RepID=UPI00367EF87D